MIIYIVAPCGTSLNLKLKWITFSKFYRTTCCTWDSGTSDIWFWWKLFGLIFWYHLLLCYSLIEWQFLFEVWWENALFCSVMWRLKKYLLFSKTENVWMPDTHTKQIGWGNHAPNFSLGGVWFESQPGCQLSSCPNSTSPLWHMVCN
jgi:hypothetical protein